MKEIGFIIGWLFSATFYLIKSTFIFISKLVDYIENPIDKRSFEEKVNFNKPDFKKPIQINKTIKPLQINKFIKPLQIDKFIIPESFEKGEKFEKYLREKIFTKEKYIMVDRTHNYEINKNDYVESTLKPDFKFRNLSSKKVFYVEAKYRSNLYDDGIKWSNPEQILRYLKYSKEMPLFVAIGFGGKPDLPDNIFLINLTDNTPITIKRQDLGNYILSEQIKKFNLN